MHSNRQINIGEGSIIIHVIKKKLVKKQVLYLVLI